MRFSFVTLFPELISGYFNDSILSRAIDKDLLEIAYINPRDKSADKWNKVDDTAVGGGAGMVMTPQPLFDTLNELRKEEVHIIFATPVGKPFNQNDAKRLAKKKHIAFVSGRYEGIDERVIE
jgi:tRNA (guanine37-N1)-methyltransferase